MLGLPERELLRISEVADYFSVTDRCIRLWIEHKHLDMVRIVGSIRVTRSSVLKCRFRHEEDVSETEIKKLAQVVKPEPAERVKPTKKALAG